MDVNMRRRFVEIDGQRVFVKPWLQWSDEPLQKNVIIILRECREIECIVREGIHGDGDMADLKGARASLKKSLLEILQSGNGEDRTENNPLWVAAMMIRPQVIARRLPTSVTEELAQALRDMKNENEPDSVYAASFGKLAGRLWKNQIGFFRAAISGGEVVLKNGNEWRTHYFPGIPFSIRKEAGVKLTTHPDNIPAVVKAYQLMAAQTAGHAKTVLEAVIADIQELSKNLYPPARVVR